MSFKLICLFSSFWLLSSHPLLLSYFIIVIFIFLISIVACFVYCYLTFWCIEGGYFAPFTPPLAVIKRFWLEISLCGRDLGIHS